MKRLMLLRHAKSLRDEKMKDKDRPLNERGRADAPRMGSYMHNRGYQPDLVLCSTAKRTVVTWELLAPGLVQAAETRFVDALYLASANSIRKTIAHTKHASSLLVIGHNPGIEECARTLAHIPQTSGERNLFAELSTKFPTCALAVFDFDIADWAGIATHGGTLVDFVRPKTLDRA